MTSAATALTDLHRALDSPRGTGIAAGNWRWTVRQQLTAVRAVLMRESEHPDDAWLSARRGRALRERRDLLSRIGELEVEVLRHPELEDIRDQALRLLADINHHLQRLRDLAYDGVEAELGGSG